MRDRPVSGPDARPVKAVFCGAAAWGDSGRPSTECNQGCFCGDAGTFVIKSTAVAQTLPYCEWFCSSLAREVGLPQVPFAVIQHTDGDLCFGSLYQRGNIANWHVLALEGEIDFNSLICDLSGIHALDLFINNDDRHVQNYIVTKEETGHRVQSFDYSRAWLYYGWPLRGLPDHYSGTTIRNKDWLKAKFPGYPDRTAVLDTLERIAAVDSSWVAGIHAATPREWLAQVDDPAILAWWSDGGAAARIERIRRGLADGSLI